MEDLSESFAESQFVKRRARLNWYLLHARHEKTAGDTKLERKRWFEQPSMANRKIYRPEEFRLLRLRRLELTKKALKSLWCYGWLILVESWDFLKFGGFLNFQDPRIFEIQTFLYSGNRGDEWSMGF